MLHIAGLAPLQRLFRLAVLRGQGADGLLWLFVTVTLLRVLVTLRAVCGPCVTDELTGVWLFVNDERLRLLVTNELMGGVALRDLCCCSS